MTPFGKKLRELRAKKNLNLKDMAQALKVSSAYLSALEHGWRSKPSSGLIQQIAAYFNLVWDDVDELKKLADLSDPKITIETAGLIPQATELANKLALKIGKLNLDQINQILFILEEEK
ncbi:MAG: helix-turn-helix domain-containing protein [Alphaproteobacteria bacterium]|nr:helix-turn-helix domain-containing protein [Alphaproteobacteria bacterium]